jgi:hypothetical protein
MKATWGWIVLSIMFIGFVSVTTSDISKVAACRDPRKWPFLSSSIWNTPIGTGAVFHDPGIFRPPFPLPNSFYSDDDYFIVTSENDPPTMWYNQGWWGGSGSPCNITGEFVGFINFPANLTVTNHHNDNAAAILHPDNHTIINTQPLYRCNPGSPVLSLQFSGRIAKDDIVFGNGIWGAHGGSGLSSIGGTIRLGELLPDASPIQHALKLQLNAANYYYDQRPGYIWPAIQCDSYAFNPNNSHRYGGKDIYLSPGSLLAIPSNLTVNVTTVPGQKLLFTLKNYGGYLCDDTYFNRGTIGTEHGVTDEFEAAYGYPYNAVPSGPSVAWYTDLLTLFQSLRVVINNSNSTTGGGGTPLQPPPPPICPI